MKFFSFKAKPELTSVLPNWLAWPTLAPGSGLIKTAGVYYYQQDLNKVGSSVGPRAMAPPDGSCSYTGILPTFLPVFPTSSPVKIAKWGRQNCTSEYVNLLFSPLSPLLKNIYTLKGRLDDAAVYSPSEIVFNVGICLSIIPKTGESGEFGGTPW